MSAVRTKVAFVLAVMDADRSAAIRLPCAEYSHEDYRRSYDARVAISNLIEAIAPLVRRAEASGSNVLQSQVHEFHAVRAALVQCIGDLHESA